MSYKLKFKEEAWKEWQSLDKTISEQFSKKLKALKENPHIPRAKLSGLKNCYKIKLRNSGFRLVYEVRNSELVIVVIAVGKRDKNEVYKIAEKRLQ